MEISIAEKITYITLNSTKKRDFEKRLIMDMEHKRYDRRDDYAGDSPIYSRLFIVCRKGLTEEIFREEFSKFGQIEDIRLPCDNGGESKGVVYIKFSKTSEAAHALEAMHLKHLPGSQRPLKVMVATNRSEMSNDDYEKYRRLFITVSKTATESDIETDFVKYGHITSILVQKDYHTGASKGFAYISYAKFSQAAHAFEECDKKYRAVFAKPKEQKRQETAFESHINSLSRSSRAPMNNELCLTSMMNPNIPYNSYTSVAFMCCPQFSQAHMRRLFDLIPGFVKCKYSVDQARSVGKGIAFYNNPRSAAYAVEKLNEFEYPPGMMIFVRPDSAYAGDGYMDNSNNYKIKGAVSKLRNVINASSYSSSPDLAQLAEAIAEASKLIKKATGSVTDTNIPDANDINYCSVKLPSPQPLADIDSNVAKRCFLVCKPSPPPLTVLRDVFCRFGDLINVYTLPNKTVGYARYASEHAANEAIRVLHGAEVCGVRIKVIEADEEAPPRKRERTD